jgi:hypothetical protein
MNDCLINDMILEKESYPDGISPFGEMSVILALRQDDVAPSILLVTEFVTPDRITIYP